MLLHALRRWFARHPTHWVLSVALGLSLTLGGAQLAAAWHEIDHTAAQSQTQYPHASAAHGCPICLLAAALHGLATAPAAFALQAPDAAIAAPCVLAGGYAPRLARAYASRAPPASALIAA
jgi:hypothetical protein